MNEDEKWMEFAIKEAIKAGKKGEVPVGAVLVKNQKIIAKAHNQPISKNDATAHAEIQLIRKSGEKQKNYRLVNSTIYVSLEPCSMCLGAIVHARISKIVFGAYDSKIGACGSSIDLTNTSFLNHKFLIKGGILEDQCSKLLKDFFKVRRKNI